MISAETVLAADENEDVVPSMLKQNMLEEILETLLFVGELQWR